MDHVELDKHTGVQSLLQALRLGEQEYRNDVSYVYFTQAQKELQKLVDDATRVDGEFADYRQKSAEKHSLEMSQVHGARLEAEAAHRACQDEILVQRKTI